MRSRRDTSPQVHGTIDPAAARQPRAAWRDDPGLLEEFNAGVRRARKAAADGGWCLGCSRVGSGRCRRHREGT